MNVAAFISFVVAAVCFFLLWIAADITHLLEAGLFFTALGLALGHLPAVVVRRGP